MKFRTLMSLARYKETAVNIAWSCNLITIDMNIVMVNEDTVDDTVYALERMVYKYQLDQPPEIQKKEAPLLALVIDGKTLGFALMHGRDDFTTIVKFCKVVICCRASPKQKAEVVKLVKTELDVITLSVGDGANDVSMIREADIGVGMRGQEGMQALRASDYALAQFSHLERLVMVHGYWGYQRIAFFICYFFYKNVILALTEFWFSFFSGYSGQVFFAPYLTLAYNAIFSSVAIVSNGVLERDLPSYQIIRYPQLFKTGQRGEKFNAYVFIKWMASAIVHSLICFFIPYVLLSGDIHDSNGKAAGMWYFSTTSFSCVIFCISYILALETKTWTFFNHIALWLLQVFIYIVSLLILTLPAFTTLPDNEMLLNIMFDLVSTANFWLALILVPVLCVLVDYTGKCIDQELFPTAQAIIQEKIYIGDEVSEEEALELAREKYEFQKKKYDQQRAKQISAMFKASSAYKNH